MAHGTGVFVLTVEREQIAVITRFGGDYLVARFGLPPTLVPPGR